MIQGDISYMHPKPARKAVPTTSALRWHQRLQLLTGAALLVLSTDQAAANVVKFTGRAFNGAGGLEYVEHHTVRYEDGMVSESKTIYLDPDNRQIGDLVSDYAEGPQYGSYQFRDLRARYEDGADVLGDRIFVFRKSTPRKAKKTNELNRIDNQIVGQGFNHFIAYNLDAIAAGQILHVRLVLPSRLSQYKFRIRLRKIADDTAYIRLEIDNWFLRLLAPYIDAEYSLKTKRLLRYEGISNLTDASGKHKKVVITYDYASRVES